MIMNNIRYYIKNSIYKKSFTSIPWQPNPINTRYTYLEETFLKTTLHTTPSPFSVYAPLIVNVFPCT